MGSKRSRNKSALPWRKEGRLALVLREMAELFGVSVCVCVYVFVCLCVCLFLCLCCFLRGGVPHHIMAIASPAFLPN